MEIKQKAKQCSLGMHDNSSEMGRGSRVGINPIRSDQVRRVSGRSQINQRAISNICI
jgi:hypothetical protein